MKWEDEKRDAWHAVIFLCLIWMIILLADLVKPDMDKSLLENKILAKRPVFSMEKLVSGEYATEYEAYAQDQFVSRDKWLKLRLDIDLFFRVHEVRDIYMGDNSYMFAILKPEKYEPLEEKGLYRISELVQKYPNIKLGLIPTKECILAEKLPFLAPNYKQKAFLEKAGVSVGEKNWLDLYSALESHDKEKVYYKGDSHLSMLGCIYIYETWMGSEKRLQRFYQPEDMETVLFGFRGNLAIPQIEDVTDQIMMVPKITEKPVAVLYDNGLVASSLMDKRKLYSEYPYDYYLGGEYGLIQVNTGYSAQGRELIVLKDSYANPIIPLLVPYYKKIYIIDETKYHEDQDAFIENHMTDKTDILVLESITGFLEN